jgi:hypothetical protein
MRKKRTNETTEERLERVQKNAQEMRDGNTREDEAIHAMVQKSVRLEGP